MSSEIKEVFKNENFIAVEKPAGWLTVPSRYEDEDQRRCLGRELESQLGQIWPVHRLDYEVSGLVLLARNAKAHAVGNSWFENGQVQKTYAALSKSQDFSHWPKNIPHSPELISVQPGLEFDWKCKIEKGKRRAFESPRGKAAHTIAKIVQFENSISFWSLQPKTGRSHQLRFEMSRHGFPILGDQLYGGLTSPRANEIALRSMSLNFENIASNDRLGLPQILVCADEQYLKKAFLKAEL